MKYKIMKKIMYTIVGLLLLIVGFQSYGVINPRNTETQQIELEFDLPEEGYINDIPFDTKEVVDSINRS